MKQQAIFWDWCSANPLKTPFLESSFLKGTILRQITTVIRREEWSTNSSLFATSYIQALQLNFLKQPLKSEQVLPLEIPYDPYYCLKVSLNICQGMSIGNLYQRGGNSRQLWIEIILCHVPRSRMLFHSLLCICAPSWRKHTVSFTEDKK